MNLLSSYAPPTFMKPVLVISTIFTDGLKETAVSFVEALNGQHALHVLFEEKSLSKKSAFIPIKKHKTIASALKYHGSLITKMRNGVGNEEWSKGFKPYLKIYNKFCPNELKQKI